MTLPSGAEIDGKVQTDVLALVGRMVDEAKYGGLVRVRGADIATIVRNFQQSAEVIEPWDSAKITHLIEAFAETDPRFDPIREAFEQYHAARRALSADGSTALRRTTAGGRQSSISRAGCSGCRDVPAPSYDPPKPPHSAARSPSRRMHRLSLD